MNTEEKVKAVVDEMDSDEIITIWNEYCTRVECYENRYECMESFNDLFRGVDPLKIAERVYYDDFNPTHDYFKDGVYGLESFNLGVDCVQDMELDELIDYIVDKDEDFGNSEIREALEDENE